MAQAPLPNGAGGYQVGDGNLTEVLMITQTAPTTKTATATLTAAELTDGIILYTGTGTANLTLPTVADVEELVSSAKIDSAFDLSFINSSATGAATVVTNTGWTLSGVVTLSAVTSSTWRARKTGDGSWTFYRIAG
jgi:hypothetical protein